MSKKKLTDLWEYCLGFQIRCAADMVEADRLIADLNERLKDSERQMAIRGDLPLAERERVGRSYGMIRNSLLRLDMKKIYYGYGS